MTINKAVVDGWANIINPVPSSITFFPVLPFVSYLIHSHPTGSHYICNPPVTDTDIDTVMLCKPGYAQALMKEGWTPCSGAEYSDHALNFTAWRNGPYNYICTTDKKFYNRWVMATKIAKAMNLLKKEDRIALFDAVLYKV